MVIHKCKECEATPFHVKFKKYYVATPNSGLTFDKIIGDIASSLEQ